jgi:hypothetical protein
VNLTTEGHDTRLAYKVKANVGGKLAQIGSRLVDAAANKVANDFFAAFNEKVGKPAHGSAHGAHDHDDEHHPAPVPRDPDLPQVSDASLSFFAAGALVAAADRAGREVARSPERLVLDVLVVAALPDDVVVTNRKAQLDGLVFGAPGGVVGAGEDRCGRAGGRSAGRPTLLPARPTV